jgi:hypothetical protein
VAVLDGFLYAVGGQDGVQCLNHVERLAVCGVISDKYKLVRKWMLSITILECLSEFDLSEWHQ